LPLSPDRFGMSLLMESGKDAASTLLLLLEMRDIRAFYVRIWDAASAQPLVTLRTMNMFPWDMNRRTTWVLR
jgi:hypothetical protein